MLLQYFTQHDLFISTYTFLIKRGQSPSLCVASSQLISFYLLPMLFLKEKKAFLFLPFRSQAVNTNFLWAKQTFQQRFL